MEFNEKTMQRYAWCKNCKSYHETNLPSPVCSSCGNKLYTVVFDMLNGKPITGDEEIDATTRRAFEENKS